MITDKNEIKTIRLSDNPCLRQEDGTFQRAWMLGGRFVNMEMRGPIILYSYPIMKYSRRDQRGTKARVMYGRIIYRTPEQIVFEPVTKSQLQDDNVKLTF